MLKTIEFYKISDAKRTLSQDNVLFKHSFNSVKVTFPACKWH